MMKKMKRNAWTELPPDQNEKILGIFTRDLSFYRTFFPLLVVIALQQLTALAVNLADNIMLGTYSELALSGATLVNQIQFTLQQISSGIGMGIVVLASQYWGRKDVKPIKKIISMGVKFGFLAGVLFFIVTIAMPENVLSLFTGDEEVIQEGMGYLRIICWTYLIYSVSSSLMYSLQSVETAVVGTVMSLSTICINVFLNYCLIYGNLGAPELGIEGAAAATLVSRTVELVIVFTYLLFIDGKLRMKLRDILQLDFTYFKDYIRVASPLVVSGALWGVAQASQTSILGHISAEAIAANSIAVIVFQIFAVAGMACANTASVTMGKTIGQGRLDRVRSYAKTMQGIFLIVGLLSAGLLFIFKDIIVGIYAVSDETAALAARFLTILSVTTVGTCYEYPVEAGIIAGGGVTKYAAWTDNLFMWLFTIPSAYLSAFFFRFPPEVTFCFLKADQILKCIPNAIVCNRFRWVRILTRSIDKEIPEM